MQGTSEMTAKAIKRVRPSHSSAPRMKLWDADDDQTIDEIALAHAASAVEKFAGELHDIHHAPRRAPRISK